MTRRSGVAAVLVAVLTVLLLASSSSSSSSVAAAAPAGGGTVLGGTVLGGTDVPRVVVVAVPGLRWDDVDRTDMPRLAAVADDAALGSLSVRAGRPRTCPVDGAAVLGAGNRARGPSTEDCPASLPLPPVEATADGGALVPGVRVLQEENAPLGFGARVAVLGEALHSSGRCTAAAGPGAATAAADPAGRVDRYAPALPREEGAVADLVAACPLTVVGLDALQGQDEPDPLDQLHSDDPADVPGDDARRRALHRVDDGVGAVADALPAGGVLLVVGTSEVGDGQPRLHVALAAGGPYAQGWLVSSSTGREPFLQLIDVAPTVLALLDVERPRQVVGQPARMSSVRDVGLGEAVDRLVDLDEATQAQRRLVPPFFVILVVAQVVLYAAALVALRRGGRGRRAATLQRLHWTALAFAAAPVATYLANLVPWWRADLLLLTLLAAVAVGTAAVVGVAAAGPWRRSLLGPAGVVVAATAGLLAVDLLTGATLQLNSLAGYSPLVAGRFAGIGNVAYAVFATGALLTAAFLASWILPRRRAAVGAVLVVGGTVVVLDGAPGLGSDFGGVLGLVPGFAFLVLRVAGLRVTLVRMLAAAALAVVVVGGFAVLDWLRPVAERTHLGRFVQQVLDGEAGVVVERKAEANINLLLHSPLTLLVPVAVAFVAVVLLRPGVAGTAGLRRAFAQRPMLRDGLLAVLVTSLVGGLANDSGIAVPALAMTVAVPVAIAASARALAADLASEQPLRRTTSTADA